MRKRSISLVIDGPGGVLLVRRAGREKLGVEIESLGLIGEDDSMRDWRARIVAGEPAVPQAGEGTQYVEWRWGDRAELAPAARAGSLCARVLLRARELAW